MSASSRPARNGQGREDPCKKCPARNGQRHWNFHQDGQRHRGGNSNLLMLFTFLIIHHKDLSDIYNISLPLLGKRLLGSWYSAFRCGDLSLNSDRFEYTVLRIKLSQIMYSTFHACHHDLLIIWKQNPPKNVSGTICVSYTVTKLILNCKSMFCLSGAREGGFYIEATCTLFSSWTWASLTCPPWPAPPPDNWHPPSATCSTARCSRAKRAKQACA